MASLIKAGLRLVVALAVWFALSFWLGWDRLPGISSRHDPSGVAWVSPRDR